MRKPAGQEQRIRNRVRDSLIKANVSVRALRVAAEHPQLGFYRHPLYQAIDVLTEHAQ